MDTQARTHARIQRAIIVENGLSKYDLYLLKDCVGVYVYIACLFFFLLILRSFVGCHCCGVEIEGAYVLLEWRERERITSKTCHKIGCNKVF